jgi:ribosomal protein L37AE/L43A
VERAIHGLPADVQHLTEIIGVFGRGFEVRVSGTRDPQLNIHPCIEALRARIDYETVYWAECVGMETPRAVRLPERVSKACRWLHPRLDRLVALGPQERSVWTFEGEVVRDSLGWRDTALLGGLGGALRLSQLHRRTRQVVGRTKLVHRLTPACPLCDQKTLVRANGADFVVCEGCGKQIEERHYDWFVQVTVAEERRRLIMA